MECSKNIRQGELIHGKDLKDTPLFKITYSNETHHGFEYRDGENVDTLQFNDDVNVTCGPGGLYFTDITSLFWFAYDMGKHNLSGHNLNIRRVTLDDGEPVVKVYDGRQYTKYRAHKIHLGPKVTLYDMATINNLLSICPKLLEDNNTLFILYEILQRDFTRNIGCAES